MYLIGILRLDFGTLAGAVKAPTPPLQRGKTPTHICSGYDSKQSDGESPVLGFWWMWNPLSMPLQLGLPWPGAVVFVRVLSIVQIKLFKHLLYLKPFNCVQTNDYQIELLELDDKDGTHLNVM